MTMTNPYARLLTMVNSPSSLCVYEANRLTCNHTRVAASPKNDGRNAPVRASNEFVRAVSLAGDIHPRFMQGTR